jgi:hypothetical protein
MAGYYFNLTAMPLLILAIAKLGARPHDGEQLSNYPKP